MCLLLACNNRAIFLLQGVAECALLVFRYLPTINGHAIVISFIATEVDMQRIPIGLHTLYHAPICGHSRRLLRPNEAYP